MVTAACSDWAVAHNTRAITGTSQGYRPALAEA